MIGELCEVIDSLDGEICLYEAAYCPIHPRTGEPGGTGPADFFELPKPSEGRPGGPFDPRKLAQTAMRAVSRGEASPNVALRFVRVLESLHRLGETGEDRELALKEAAVIGSIMHGIPPNSPENWTIAEKFYDVTTLDFLRHMHPIISRDLAVLEHHTFPLPGTFHCEDFGSWGNRAVGYDPAIHGDIPTPPLPSLEHCRHVLPEHIARMAAEQGTKLYVFAPGEKPLD